MASSVSIVIVVVFLACVIFPAILGIVAFCMMMRMSEDIRWLRFKDDPGSKKPMPYMKVIISCIAVSVILAVLLSSPFISVMSKGALNLPTQTAQSTAANTFKG